MKVLKRSSGLWGLLSLLVVLSLVLTPMVVMAATTQDVTVNATPTYISISNSPTSFDFGVIAAGVTNLTTNTTEDHFSLTDTSTINVTTTIVSNGWDGGANDWTTGSPAADTGELRASDGDGAYDVTVDDVTPVTLHTSASIGEDWTWELGLDGPTSFGYGNEQTTTVTLSAAAS